MHRGNHPRMEEDLMSNPMRFEPTPPPKILHRRRRLKQSIDGNAKRVWLKRGKISRKLLLVAPPFPEKGDEITLNGQGWFVVKIKEEKVLAAFERHGST